MADPGLITSNRLRKTHRSSLETICFHFRGEGPRSPVNVTPAKSKKIDVGDLARRCFRGTCRRNVAKEFTRTPRDEPETEESDRVQCIDTRKQTYIQVNGKNRQATLFKSLA